MLHLGNFSCKKWTRPLACTRQETFSFKNKLLRANSCLKKNYFLNFNGLKIFYAGAPMKNTLIFSKLYLTPITLLVVAQNMRLKLQG